MHPTVTGIGPRQHPFPQFSTMGRDLLFSKQLFPFQKSMRDSVGGCRSHPSFGPVTELRLSVALSAHTLTGSPAIQPAAPPAGPLLLSEPVTSKATKPAIPPTMPPTTAPTRKTRHVMDHQICSVNAMVGFDAVMFRQGRRTATSMPLPLRVHGNEQPALVPPVGHNDVSHRIHQKVRGAISFIPQR